MMKTTLLSALHRSIICTVFLITSLCAAQAADHNIFPEKVTDFTATWDGSTGFVTLTLTAPTNSMESLGSGNGDPLPYLTRIVISRNYNYGDYTEIHVFDNPQPGETLTFVDESADGGLYQYRAVAYMDDYASYPEWVEILVGQLPVDINDAVATCNKGEAPVIIMFTAPSLDTEGNPLKKLVKIEVLRYNNETFSYQLIGTIEQPEPGSKCTYEDYDVISGNNYSYRLVPYASAGNAYGTLVDVVVGYDAPVAPANVVAEVRNNEVIITWTAPTVGQTNGYIDPAELTYSVLRSNTGSEYDAELLASNITATTYVDQLTYDVETKCVYYVEAANEQGESVGAASNPIVLGPPSTLAYNETFDTMTEYGAYTTDHAGWLYTSSETVCAWFINDVVELEDRSITTEDKTGGLAFAMYGIYSAYEQDDYMTTGWISVANEPICSMSLNYYAFVGCNSYLAIEVTTDDETFTEAGRISYEDMQQEGWERYDVMLSDFYPMDSELIKVRLHAHKGTTSMPIIVDNIEIIDAPTSIDATQASSCRVWALNGTLYIDTDNNTPVAVYSTTGSLVYTTTGDAQVALNNGIYIVKVGGEVRKVIL